MGYGSRTDLGNRITSITAVAVVHILMAYVLVTGLQYSVVRHFGTSLNVIPISPTAPPRPESEPVPEEEQAARKEAAAASPNLRAEPTKIVVPPPIIPTPKINPVVTAPAASDQNGPVAGAADKPGTGTGSAGSGSGTGSGERGTGTGGGVATKPRLRSGRITRSDYPRSARDAKAGGVVIAHFTVNPDGRVSNCRVRQSSGHAELDQTTCRLIEQRFRYEPARDANGQAVREITGWKQDWWLERGGRRVTD